MNPIREQPSQPINADTEPQPQTQSYINQPPHPGLGEPPAPNMELERYLAEEEAFRELETPDGKNMIIGDVPPHLKRGLYAMASKNVINANLDASDKEDQEIEGLKAKMWELMFTRRDRLTDISIQDLNQMHMMFKSKLTQAKDGEHSKQRTTSTSVFITGNKEDRPVQPNVKWG